MGVYVSYTYIACYSYMILMIANTSILVLVLFYEYLPIVDGFSNTGGLGFGNNVSY